MGMKDEGMTGGALDLFQIDALRRDFDFLLKNGNKKDKRPHL